MSNDDYRPGNPEYDYWNDKNLYPGLRHKYDDEFEDGFARSQKTQASTEFNNGRISGGSVPTTFLIWFLTVAPVTLFLTWDNWLVQVLFWGGIAIILLVFVLWLHDAAK